MGCGPSFRSDMISGCSVLGESKGAHNRSARRNAVRAALRMTLRALLGALPVAVAQTSQKLIEACKLDPHAAVSGRSASRMSTASRAAMTAWRFASRFEILTAGVGA